VGKASVIHTFANVVHTSTNVIGSSEIYSTVGRSGIYCWLCTTTYRILEC
jgi:hypothetical protein